jgi:outer membrane lipoprotein-sorting protein
MAEKVEKPEVLRKSKLDEKEAYVLAVYPKGGNRVLYDISTESFLPLRQSTVIVSSTSAIKIPVSQRYYDYRDVDGVKIPFRLVNNNPGLGDLITTIKKIKNNVRIPDKKFYPKK